MALVDERNVTSFGGGKGNFWGLVQQDGPWAPTRNDRKNASGRAAPVRGGGLGAGGTQHAGHGRWQSTTNPYQQNARKPPPAPSMYAQRRVVVKAQNPNKPQPVAGRKAGVNFYAGRAPEQASQGIVKKPDFQEGEFGRYPDSNAAGTQTEPEIKIEPDLDDYTMMADAGTQAGAHMRDGSTSPPPKNTREGATSPMPSPVKDHAMLADTYQQTDAPIPLMESSFQTEHHMVEGRSREMEVQTDVMQVIGGKRPRYGDHGGAHKGSRTIGPADYGENQANFLHLEPRLKMGAPIEGVPVETFKPPRSTLFIEGSAEKEAEADVKKEAPAEKKAPLSTPAQEPVKKRKSTRMKKKPGEHEAKLRVKKLAGRVAKLSGPKGDSLKLKKAKEDLLNAERAAQKFK